MTFPLGLALHLWCMGYVLIMPSKMKARKSQQTRRPALDCQPTSPPTPSLPENEMGIDPYLYRLLAVAKSPTLGSMRKGTMAVLKEASAEGALEGIVRQMVAATGIQGFLPSRYAAYQPVVVEGLIFMMSRLPLTRLAEKVVDQLRLSPDALPALRLYTLIKDMPTLQKLGQVICRNPGLDPEFKRFFVDLEDNIQTVSVAHLHTSLKREIKRGDPAYCVIPEKKILAEATVCAVVPATVQTAWNRPAIRAVLKVVKPRIKRHMSSELALIDRLVIFLDQNRHAWGLGDFDFQSTLAQVRTILANEVDLVSEQKNIDLAGRHFRCDPSLSIPERLPASTPFMTVMTRLDGTKITEVQRLSKAQRRRLAAAVADICILGPIQDARKGGLFHGDPHAGNLAYRFDRSRPQIIFYDWGMLGRLTPLERTAMLLLVMGLLTGSEKLIFYTSDVLTRGQLSKANAMRRRSRKIIHAAVSAQPGDRRGGLSSIEFLFEKLTREGVVFSSDLMMFEKALLTLKGVLADIDPTFDRDAHMVRGAVMLFVNDLIRLRILALFLKEAWRLYRHSLALLIDLQKVIFWLVQDAVQLAKHVPDPLHL